MWVIINTLDYTINTRVKNKWPLIACIVWLKRRRRRRGSHMCYTPSCLWSCTKKACFQGMSWKAVIPCQCICQKATNFENILSRKTRIECKPHKSDTAPLGSSKVLSCCFHVNALVIMMFVEFFLFYSFLLLLCYINLAKQHIHLLLLIQVRVAGSSSFSTPETPRPPSLGPERCQRET